MDLLNKFYLSGILLLLTIGFGFWIGRLGKPYHNLLFNIHKLIALGGVVLTGIRIFRMDPLITFSSAILLFLILAVIGVVALFVSGAIMSIQPEDPKLFKWIHQASVILTSLAAFLALFQMDGLQL
jgi:hypothetical protein